MDTSTAEVVFIIVSIVGTAGPHQGFESGQGQGILSSRKPPDSATLPASYSKVDGGSFLGLKRPEREVEHSHPSRGEFVNKLRYSTSLPICF